MYCSQHTLQYYALSTITHISICSILPPSICMCKNGWRPKFMLCAVQICLKNCCHIYYWFHIIYSESLKVISSSTIGIWYTSEVLWIWIYLGIFIMWGISMIYNMRTPYLSCSCSYTVQIFNSHSNVLWTHLIYSIVRLPSNIFNTHVMHENVLWSILDNTG